MQGEGNLIFSGTGSRENYFGSVAQQNIINNLKFQGHIKLKILIIELKTRAIASVQITYET